MENSIKSLIKKLQMIMNTLKELILTDKDSSISPFIRQQHFSYETLLTKLNHCQNICKGYLESQKEDKSFTGIEETFRQNFRISFDDALMYAGMIFFHTRDIHNNFLCEILSPLKNLNFDFCVIYPEELKVLPIKNMTMCSEEEISKVFGELGEIVVRMNKQKNDQTTE